MSRLFFLIAAIGALFVSVTHLTVQAGPNGWEEYEEAAFMMAQKKGRTIVVAVGGADCAKCREQTAALDRLMGEHPAHDTLFVKVDFDRERAFLDRHGVASRPTVLVFEGLEEVGRSGTGTDPADLSRAVSGAL
ncbi:MAG: thioredoxin family protein [Erythrobacter sp.]